MILLIAFVIFLTIVLSNWWLGMWNCLINLINFFIAALVASSFYENLAAQIVRYDGTFSLIADFVSVWVVFVVTFIILRLTTDFLSRYRSRVDLWVEYTGRSVFSIWLAAGFICFSFFTFHLAPFPPNTFSPDPSRRVLGIGPDHLWLAFIQSRSRGALAEPKQSNLFPAYELEVHPDDVDLDARVFDSQARYIFDNLDRRVRISNNRYLRTN